MFSPKGNYKGFRLTKNGNNTGVFERIPINGRNEDNNARNNNAEQNNNNHLQINLERRNKNEENNIDLEN